MNEHINLTKILKDCPKGTIFYSSIYENVCFEGINDDSVYPIQISNSRIGMRTLSEKGRIFIGIGECILFPSKEQRDWSKFTTPWYNKENIDLTKILKNCPKDFELYSTIHGKVYFNCITNNKEYPICLKHENNFIHFTKNGKYAIDKPYGECVLLPSKEQRDWNKFSAPWHKKERFDPKTLNPFDKVIARCSDFKWVCDMFSHYDKSKCFMPYVCVGGIYEVCIPYNDDTKYLVCTKEEAPKYYRCWED